MQVYLDNAATTRCGAIVAQAVTEAMTKEYGNPSSMHQKGVAAEGIIRRSAGILADALKVEPKEIYFTSGGTESNNMAILGAALAHRRRGNHIVTTAVEHPSVANVMKFLEQQGFDITVLGVDRQGLISVEAFREALREDTILVSAMHVNNEVGTVEPIDQMGQILRERGSQALFHVDAVQGFGKYRIFPRKLQVDLLSVSGHKIHGPKGVGALYVGAKARIRPTFFGGGQQKDLRPGTENVPGIAGLGKAVEQIYDGFEEKISRIQGLRQELEEGLRSLEQAVINGPGIQDGAPHIVNASFPGVRSEVLLHALEDRGIYVSAGSACASNGAKESAVLVAMGLEKTLRQSAIRFSLSEENNSEEIAYCLEQLRALLPLLRKYQSK